jgi:hypothetical protein
VTVLVVGVGVLTSGFGRSDSGSTDSPASANLSGAVPTSSAASPPSTSSTPAARAAVEARTLGTSRSTARVPLVNNRVPKATGKRWTTGLLKLRVEPRAKGRTTGLLAEDRRVRVTGRSQNGYTEVLVKRTPRWVTAEYLSKKREVPETRTAAVSSGASGSDGAGAAPESAAPSTGLSGQPCPDGSSIESGLQPAAVKVYRATCAAFPELRTYGGQDGHGEHVNGQAIDFMVTDSSTGQRLADYLYAHHAELDLFDIIWAQRIWTIERSGEGFRSMSDRGSATANHFDHVHIMVN